MKSGSHVVRVNYTLIKTTKKITPHISFPKKEKKMKKKKPHITR